MIKFLRNFFGLALCFLFLGFMLYLSLSFAAWEFIVFDEYDLKQIRFFTALCFYGCILGGIISLDDKDYDKYEIKVPKHQRLGQAIMNAYRDKWYVGSDARGPVHQYWDIWEEDDEKIQEAINNISK